MNKYNRSKILEKISWGETLTYDEKNYAINDQYCQRFLEEMTALEILMEESFNVEPSIHFVDQVMLRIEKEEKIKSSRLFEFSNFYQLLNFIPVQAGLFSLSCLVALSNLYFFVFSFLIPTGSQGTN